jgi:hypothetical protein
MKKKTVKKKVGIRINRADATLRNVRASNRRDQALSERVSNIEKLLTALLGDWRQW